jgi:hypothetical protein
MKKLIFIQNDYPGAGKSTVVRLLRRYLGNHQVEHRFLFLSEDEECIEPNAEYFDPTQISGDALLNTLDQPGITLLEAGSGAGEYFMKQYERHDYFNKLHDRGIELTVVLPVNNDCESYEAVTESAEIFGDTVQYLIAHNATSAYYEDSSPWDSSYAARLMDMFEAVELRFPEATIEMEQNFRMKHTTLAKAMLEAEPESLYGKDCGRWMKRAIGQVETARQYVFGDHFRALAEPDKPTRKARGPKKKEQLALA